MSLIAIFAVAFALAMDAFAVAIVAGTRFERLSFRPVFRLSFHFGLWQALMTLIGWAAGRQIDQLIRDYDHWVAFGLLLIVGGRMIYESVTRTERNGPRKDLTRKWTMVMLSVATSIDALAVGLSMALLQVNIWRAALIIGLVASGMTIIGMAFGKEAGSRFGRWMEIAGGLGLIGIGVNILYEHLTA